MSDHPQHDPHDPQPAAKKAQTVTVTAAKTHTHDGKSYEAGDTYEIDEQYADSVQAQGMAFRVDQPKAAAAKKSGHPVEAMDTDDVPTKKHTK